VGDGVRDKRAVPLRADGAERILDVADHELVVRSVNRVKEIRNNKEPVLASVKYYGGTVQGRIAPISLSQHNVPGNMITTDSRR
jgi:hypothetical protein